MDVAVVVAFPAQSPDISAVFERIAAVLDPIPQQRWAFIGLIQGDTAARRQADSFASDMPEVRLIHGKTLIDAMPPALEGFDRVVTMNAAVDAAEDLPALIAASHSADIVVGSRVKSSVVRDTDARLLRNITGGTVNDPSCAFRVYRADAARQLHFDAEPAAILVEANDLGFDIVEMKVASNADPIPDGTGSRLWKQHWTSSGARNVALLVLLGLAVFLLWSYPVHRYQIDADAALAGMCGTDVLNGHHWAFFPGGYRLGSGACYLSAAVIKVFGPTRSAFPIVTLIYAAAFLIFLYLALEVALGRAAATAGLIIAAFPPLQYFFFVEPPTPYGELMAAVALAMWVSFLLIFRPALHSRALSFVFGLVLGIAFWVSPESLMVTFPLGIFVLVRRGLRTPFDFALAVLGGAVGLLAYIVITLTRGALFLGEFAAQPAKGWQQFTDNLEYILTFVLPLFLFDTAGSVTRWSPVQGLALLLLLSALIATARVAWKAFASAHTGRITRRGLTAAFTIAVVVTSIILFAVSGAGSIRGWTTRYLAPIFVTLPLMAATLYSAARRQGMQALVVACAVALAILNSLNYRVLAHPDRQEKRQAHIDGQNAWNWLEGRGRDVVIGDYWLAYRLNYGYGQGITFLPAPMFFDYLFLKDRLPAGKPVHLALMHTDASALAAWAARAGLPGHVEPIPGGFAFVVDGEIDPKRLDAVAAARG